MLTDLGTPEIAGGFGLGAIILYKLYRAFMVDRSTDSGQKMQDSLRDSLMKMVADLNIRADTFAQQRNEAIANNAQLKADQAILLATMKSDHSLEMTRLREDTSEEVIRLKTQISAVILENRAMKKKLGLETECHTCNLADCLIAEAKNDYRMIEGGQT